MTFLKRKAPLLSGAMTLLSLSLLIGCATQNKSAGLGGLIGATGGAAIGGIADPGK